MTTEPDPAEAVPTDNSAGAPVDERQLEEQVHADPAADAADRLQHTPGPAGGDPVVGGLADVTDE